MALGLVLKPHLANMAIEAPRAAFKCKNTALGLGIYIEEKIPNP